MIKEYEEGIYVDMVPEGGKKKHSSKNNNPIYDFTNKIESNSFFKGVPVEALDYESVRGKRYYAHGLVEMLHNAFKRHNPVEITPDNIWLMIAQAISQHEETTGILGQVFDLPKEKKEIEIVANEFTKGSADNDWTRVFGQFETEIKKNVPETLYNLISSKKYSTTTPIDQICYTICLMDSLKKYFSYSVMTKCEIPQIYIKGTRKDWEELYQNTQQLSVSGLKLDKWFPVILEIIQEFINCFDKKINKKFWSSIYKYMNESGGPTISGWILAFFPYVINKRNGELEKANWIEELNPEYHWLETLQGGWNGLMKPSAVPNGINIVPFKWKYLGKEYDYNFYGGFLGLMQEKDTGRLGTRNGWAVGIRKVKKSKKKKKGRWFW